MLIRVNQLKVPLEYSEKTIRKAAAKKLGVSSEQIGEVSLLRRSLDARSPSKPPACTLTVAVHVAGRKHPAWRRNPDISFPADESKRDLLPPPPVIRRQLAHRPVVVGAGPAGLMAALVLARAGLKPLVFERGKAVEERAGQVNRFWRDGTLDPQSNALFGEGGAGLFSDGKLTSRSKDRPRIRFFFETLVAAGAPPEILIDAMPHVGSDRLLRIVPKVRAMIAAAGGEFLFNHCLESIHSESGHLEGITVSGRDIPCSVCVLAIGHSARDTARMLHRSSMGLTAKSFAVGLRVEIPQQDINRSQWGRWHDHPCLGAASFKLTRREESHARACYSFCMCPGGTVIACASDPGMLTTNGMSLHSRGNPFGNAAFLVPIEPHDYQHVPSADPLAGFAFQAHLEEAAWKAGGGDFSLPASPLEDFLESRDPEKLPENRSCLRARPASLTSILPGFVADTLQQALPLMLRQMKTVDPASVLLYGTETRSSSPVRIERGEDFQMPACRGIFPCGEGAGYAGGIVSSGIDGIKAAEAIVKNMGVA